MQTPGLNMNSKISPDVFKFPFRGFMETVFGRPTSWPVGKDADPLNIDVN